MASKKKRAKPAAPRSRKAEEPRRPAKRPRTVPGGTPATEDSAIFAELRSGSFRRYRLLTSLDAEHAAILCAKVSGRRLALNHFLSLDDEVARVFGKHTGGFEMKRLASTSAFALEQLGGTDGAILYLPSLRAISGRGLRGLSRFPGVLNLSGLERLSDEGAAALEAYRGPSLYLDGVVDLSEAAASSLGSLPAQLLHVGVRELPAANARALARFAGALRLAGVKELAEGAAHALSKHRGKLDLSGLRHLDEDDARELAAHTGEVLFLSGLRSLSEPAAAALASHTGQLYLDGLSSLSDECAEHLSHHPGDMLALRGLTTLSPSAANAFSDNHRGNLAFNMLTDLSDDALRGLMRHEAVVHLPLLTTRRMRALNVPSAPRWVPR